MNKKTCFIGHRHIYKLNEVRDTLYKLVEKEINKGCKFFTMGTHGEFDKLALCVCRELRKTYNDICIQVVITSLKSIEPIIEYDLIWGNDRYVPYNDVDTVMYEIEQVHFKRKIIVSNKRMIDGCTTLICYVDTDRNNSGAKTAMKYALNKGLNVINIYKT